MHHRHSRSSPRKTPTIGSVRAPFSRGGANPENSSRSKTLEDTAANDRYIPIIDADIFQEPPGIFKRLSLMYGAIIRRLIFFAVIVGAVGYFYPDSLSTLISGTKQFVVLLEGNIREFFDAEGDVTNIGLARLQALSEPEAKVADAVDKKVRSREMDNILNEIASEIATADVKQERRQERKKAQNNETIGALNKALREKFEQKPPQRVPVVIHTKKATKKTTTQTALFQQRERTVLHKISDDELNEIIHRYSKSFIFGDIGVISKLFLNSGSRQQQQSIAKLKQRYITLFENSSQRWIEFQDLTWVHANNSARGTGFIKSETSLHDNRRSIVEANVVIELRRVNKQIKITSLHLSDKKTSITELRPGKFESTVLPTETDLQDMIAQFVTAYEHADIEVLNAMFSHDMKSNSRSSKEEIRQDYEDLFSSSSSREMYIQDLHWKFSKKHAKGVGDIKAVVISTNDVRVVTGKIQFVVKKVANKVLITHLFHIEHSQQ